MKAWLVAAVLTAVPARGLRQLPLPVDPYCPGNDYSNCSRHPACAPGDEDMYPKNTSCPPSAITNCHGGHHGFGNQYSLFLAHLVFARTRDLPFCPTPWSAMAHGQNASVLYEFVGGRFSGPPAAYSTVASWLTREGLRKAGKHLDEIRNMYFQTPKPGLLFEGGRVSVAWHWRRGDSPYKNSNQSVIDGLTALKAANLTADGSKLQTVHFLTDATTAEFEPIFEACEETLHIQCKRHEGTDVQSDFHHLVMADVMVQSKWSTFSGAAAALNRGSVFLDRDLGQGSVRAVSLEERLFVWDEVFEIMME